MTHCKIVNINSLNTSRQVVMDSPMAKSLEKIIKKMKLRIEREIPDRGYFRNFAENFDKNKKPDFWGKDIALFIERDSQHEGHAYLGVSVLHPTMAIENSTYFMNGNRKKILEYLNRDNFAQELQNTIVALAESLQK